MAQEIEKLRRHQQKTTQSQVFSNYSNTFSVQTETPSYPCISVETQTLKNSVAAATQTQNCTAAVSIETQTVEKSFIDVKTQTQHTSTVESETQTTQKQYVVSETQTQVSKSVEIRTQQVVQKGLLQCAEMTDEKLARKSSVEDFFKKAKKVGAQATPVHAIECSQLEENKSEKKSAALMAIECSQLPREKSVINSSVENFFKKAESVGAEVAQIQAIECSQLADEKLVQKSSAHNLFKNATQDQVQNGQSVIKRFHDRSVKGSECSDLPVMTQKCHHNFDYGKRQSVENSCRQNRYEGKNTYSKFDGSKKYKRNEKERNRKQM